MHTDICSLDADAWRPALEALAAYARDEGFVRETYEAALLEREAEYPTGLYIEPQEYGLAIPHANPEHVIEQALVIGLPDDAATFRSMDDPADSIPAELVLLLVVGDEDGYNEFLASLIPLFKQDRFASLVADGDGEAIRELIRSEASL